MRSVSLEHAIIAPQHFLGFRSPMIFPALVPLTRQEHKWSQTSEREWIIIWVMLQVTYNSVQFGQYVCHVAFGQCLPFSHHISYLEDLQGPSPGVDTMKWSDLELNLRGLAALYLTAVWDHTNLDFVWSILPASSTSKSLLPWASSVRCQRNKHKLTVVRNDIVAAIDHQSWIVVRAGRVGAFQGEREAEGHSSL